MSEQGQQRYCTMETWYLWSYYSDHSGWSGKSESPEMAHRDDHHHNSVWEHAKTLCRTVAWLIVIIIRKYVITLYSLPKGKHSFKELFFFFPSDSLKTVFYFKRVRMTLGWGHSFGKDHACHRQINKCKLHLHSNLDFQEALIQTWVYPIVFIWSFPDGCKLFCVFCRSAGRYLFARCPT